MAIFFGFLKNVNRKNVRNQIQLFQICKIELVF